MGETINLRGLDQLEKALTARARKIERDTRRGIARTVRRGVGVVRKRVPKAFEQVADSVHADENKIVADAPHSAAVEKGSIPHMPPLEPIIRWVKLRGLQGLTAKGRLRRRFKDADGPTTAKHASAIARMLREQVVGKGKGRHSPIDAAVQVAKAIQQKIAKSGTKPSWFARSSLEDIREILDQEMKRAFGK